MNSNEAAGVLGVDPGVVTLDQIQLAYRTISKVTHPDAGGDPAEFRRLTEAKRVLEAHVRRRRGTGPPPAETRRRLRPEDFGRARPFEPEEPETLSDLDEALRKLADSMKIPDSAFRDFSESMDRSAREARRTVAKVRFRPDGALEVQGTKTGRAIFYLPKTILEAIDDHLSSNPPRRNTR